MGPGRLFDRGGGRCCGEMGTAFVLVRSFRSRGGAEAIRNHQIWVSVCGQFERKSEIPGYKYKTNSSVDISTCN